MYCDGFHNLTAIDISEVAIRQCQERDKEYPQIKCISMDSPLRRSSHGLLPNDLPSCLL